MSNKYEATFNPGDGPTDQGAREALVEQLAEARTAEQIYTQEAWSGCDGSRWANVPQGARDGWEFAARLEAHVAAQVEAAVSVVRADLTQAIAERDSLARMLAAELSPSPAEETR